MIFFYISVVDIPSIDYVHHLERPEILLNDEEDVENTVFHFSPPKIIASKEYQNYMQKFPIDTMHVITAEKFA